ncbi:ABC transporter permease [Candidatus Spongiihabitans sp.]|uniref:ABC transporter permease n=1 Tax=Candidatus Spongiihabitans sp. TaxID=3101308 RepID=UPI003C6EE455
MLDLMLLALRNIFRNVRRTIITVFSIVVGFAAMACFGGFIEFSFTGLRETTIRTQLGHLQIYAKGYWEKRVSDPESVLIADYKEVVDALNDLPGVSTVTQRLSFSGLASTGLATVNVSVIGVHPEREQDFADFETVVDGRHLRAGDTEAGVIGEELQKGLGAKLNDWVTVVTSSLDGVINAVDFQVVGIVRTGSKEYDSVFVKIPIELAQRARETDKVERIIVLLESTDDLPKLGAEIQRRLGLLEREFETRRWDELAGFYTAVVSLYTGIFTIFAGIVGLVVMFSVANTMTMAVLERTAEIGALRAIGARRATLIAMFLWEGIGIGLLGGVFGILASWLIAAAVDMAGGISMPPPPGMSQGHQAYFAITGEVLLKSFAVVMTAVLLSSFYPALTAARIRIVEALQKS